MSTSFVVWEHNDHGYWVPYSPGVSQGLENARIKGINQVELGLLDPSLQDLNVNLTLMTQTSTKSRSRASTHAVRRSILPYDGSCFCMGQVWMWMGDSMWHAYSTDVQYILHEASALGHQSVDLSLLPNNPVPYLIDLVAKRQTRHGTGMQRAVHLAVGVQAYPVNGEQITVYPVHLNQVHQVVVTRAAAAPPRAPAAAAASNNHVPTSSQLLKAAKKGVKTRMTARKSTATAAATTKTGSGKRSSAAAASNDEWDAPSTSSASNSGSAAAATKDVIERYTKPVETVPKDEDCCVCLEQLTSEAGYGDRKEDSDVVALSVCGHMMHAGCLAQMQESAAQGGSAEYIQCPTCKAIHGVKVGNQPAGGSMKVVKMKQSCSGYEGSGTLCIVYHVPAGTQGNEHPHPGQPYRNNGFPRHCYLPDTDEGRKVLDLLKVAWQRRLTFTVGDSTTTGAKDTVVWNEIHHKTEMNSNLYGHGYPDPHYLSRVQLELASHGVVAEADSK